MSKAAIARFIVGGPFPRASGVPVPPLGGASGGLGISWSWHDRTSGVVAWRFENPGVRAATGLLLRNGYYFGNAFWPVYLAHPSFRTRWASRLEPLADLGVDENAAPLGVVGFAGGRRIVAFLFTLAPGSTWSILEGGFSAAQPPQGAGVVGAEFRRGGDFCIGYDPAQVTAWDQQTQTGLQGTAPNPATVTTLEVAPAGPTPFVQLYPDPIAIGPC
ncbi:MAG: hypothetical protein AAFA34_03490 [Thermoplasmata archaeon]|jgi:hypothetical protein